MQLSDQSHSQDSQIQQKQPQENSLQNIDIDKQAQNNEQQKDLSKKQRKKIMKRQKWQKQKLIKRQQKRQKQKQKKKLKKELMSKEVNLQSNNIQKQGQILLMKKRKENYFQKMKEGLKVVIDLQFYDLMTQKEQNSLIKQLGYCHSVNRKNQKSFHYILTSATKQRQNIFSLRYNADRWGVDMHEKPLLELYELQKLVYLTGDAEEEIQQFQADKIYIIGGIVDHNRLKKITYNYAIENKINVKRLPMKNVHLKASVHLAVNHVWQWMLKKYNGFTWDQSLKSVIPIRKLQLANNAQCQ